MPSTLTHSYSHGGREIPLEFWRSFDRLPHWASLTPEKDIVVFREPNGSRQSISFAKYHRITDGIASYLIRNHPDLQVGDNVLIMGPNCLSYCLVSTGLQKAGLTSLKLHPQKAASLQHWVRKTNTKAVFYYADNGVFQTGADWLQDSTATVRLGFDTLLRVGEELMDTVKSDELQLVLEKRQALISADDNLCLYPTSGTTGEPKLVAQSHFSMVNSVRFRAMSALLNSEDIFFTDRATAHIVGDFGLLMSMVQGLTLVIAPTGAFASDRSAKNAAWLLDMLAEEKVTSGDFFGYIVHDILHKAGRSPPDCLRSALIAGSMTTSQQMAAAMSLLPGIVNYYGSTETSMITTPCPPWGPTDDQQARRDTVGLPAMHMEVIVTEPNNRSAIPLPVGGTGEIWVRGFSVMRGYYNDPEKTREAMTETGWYRTGDLGHIDANGRVTVTGRIKDLIIRGSVNIAPSSVEQVLQRHPALLAVVALGVPDERLGEELAVCIVLRKERRELQQPELDIVRELVEWCEAQGMKETRDGLSNTPRYWAILDDFPTSHIGKIVRSEVREHVTNGKGFIDSLEFFTGN